HRGRRPPAGTQPGPRRPRLRPAGPLGSLGTPRRNRGGVPRPRWRSLGAGHFASKPLWRAETTVHAQWSRHSTVALALVAQRNAPEEAMATSSGGDRLWPTGVGTLL